MEKLFCMQVAAQLTVAASSGIGIGTSRPVDPTLQDPTQRAVDLEVWEIFRAYYSAVTGALKDDQSWPAPSIKEGSVVPSIITSALKAAMPDIGTLLSSGPLSAIIGQVLKALPAQAQLANIPQNLPNPGSAAKQN